MSYMIFDCHFTSSTHIYKINIVVCCCCVCVFFLFEYFEFENIKKNNNERIWHNIWLPLRVVCEILPFSWLVWVLYI